MHKLSAWFTRNPVASNLVMLLILVAGFFTLQHIRIEGFPAIEPNSITINTFYPGANTEQVDRSISVRIENALKGMGGIKKIRSESFDGYSAVWVQKTTDMDLDRFQNDIKTRIDAIPNLPQLAERPIITRDEFTISALIVQVFGDVDEITLQKSADLVKEKLQAHPKISRLQLFGLKSHEIRIELNEAKLNSLGLSLLEIGEKINSSSLDYKTGYLKSNNGTIIVRADYKAFQYEEFLNIPIRTTTDGSRILLKDIAKIVDSFEEQEGFAKFQGKPSVGMIAFTSKKGHLIDVSEATREVLEEIKDELPPNVKLDIWGETSVYMKNRLSLLATNAWQGLLIVFVLLTIFLNGRLAFWVAMGIPISLAGAIALMGERFLDYSLNDITTFGLILVMGILVDDAIVVGESVFEERRTLKDRFDGTIKGVNKVATATIFGAFTTVAAFSPILLIDNDLGKVFASFSVIVIAAVLFSLFESKFILPAHLAALKEIDAKPHNWFTIWLRKLQDKASQMLNFMNKKIYVPILKKVLHNKISFILVFSTVAIISIAMIFNGTIKTAFFPQIPGNIITIALKMNSGSPIKLTIANLDKIEKAAEDINKEYSEKMKLEHPPIKKIMVGLTDAYNAEIYAELQEGDLKKVETLEIIDAFRNKVGELEGTERLEFSGTFETGGDFQLELVSSDIQILKQATDEMTMLLWEIDGVHDLTDNLNSGSPQLRLSLKKEAEHLGITVQTLAGQIGDAFGGLEIQRLQRASKEVKVFVNYEKENRKYIADLLNFRVRNDQVTWFPLSLIADIKYETAETSISRINGLLTASITANLNHDKITSEEVFYWADHLFENDLKNKYPGLKLKRSGELEEMVEIRSGLQMAFAVVVLIIFSLLAIPLKSYWQPLVIMSVIPFGFVGAAYGHLIMNYQLSILSFFGMLAVMGIVVNDSLVMLTRFNDLRSEGMPIKEALVKAGSSRFRAIFLTTVTTVAGLTPLMAETSEQAQYLIPAAISLAFGEIFATTVTLFIIPSLLGIVYDLQEKYKSKFSFRASLGEANNTVTS